MGQEWENNLSKQMVRDLIFFNSKKLISEIEDIGGVDIYCKETGLEFDDINGKFPGGYYLWLNYYFLLEEKNALQEQLNLTQAVSRSTDRKKLHSLQTKIDRTEQELFTYCSVE